jgi:hypothetical protein
MLCGTHITLGHMALNLGLSHMAPRPRLSHMTLNLILGHVEPRLG